MPTDSRTTKIFHPVTIYKAHNLANNSYGYGPTTYSAWVGTDATSRTYVQARKRPLGFVNPKAYSRSVEFGCTQAHYPYYSYAYDKNASYPKGVEGMVNGFDTTSFQGFAVLPFDSGLANKAVVAARLKLKDQHVNYAVSFAEARETASTITNTARNLAGAFTAFKRGKFAKAASYLGLSDLRVRRRHKPRSEKELHDMWLEVQYGWKPLLSDIYGAASDLAAKDSQDSQRYNVTVKATRSSFDKYRDVLHKQDSIGSNVTVKRSRNTTFDAFIRLDYFMDNPYLHTLAQKGFTNPLSVAWELVPYSFVVDWFLPIGNYLDQLDADSGFSFRAGSLSLRQTTKCWYSASVDPVRTSTKIRTGGCPRCSYYKKTLSRTVYSSSPSGSLGLRNPLSGLHLANATALLSAAFSRKRGGDF